LARVTRSANQGRRLLALAEIYDGDSRTAAARIGGVGLQIVGDWVVRFNARGPDGLLDGKAPGKRSVLDDAQMSELGLDINNVGTAGNTPEAIGNNAAKLVLASRANDGANQSGTQAGSAAPPNPYSDYTGYVPINPPALAFAATERRHIVDVGRWQPIAYVDPLSGSVRTPGFIAPHWQNVKPFALSSANQFRPTPPEHPNSQAFLDQSRYVIEVQRELTLEQKIIAEYWADGPRSWLPPGHWCEIAGEVSRAKLHNVDKDVSPSYS